MYSDIFFVYYWWLILGILGLLFLPFTFKVFDTFYDKGYIFSKIISISAVSYFVWLLGEFKILSFSFAGAWFIAILLGLGNYYIFKKNRKEFFASLYGRRKIIIFEEAVFSLALLTWAIIRGFEPRIEGLEKFMDFGFINSMLRSQYFPPKDIWLSGSTINYYYFGHLIAAVITKMSLLVSAVTYNLIIATTFAMTFVAAFSLSLNLIYFSFDKNLSSKNASEKKVVNRRLHSKLAYMIFGGFISASALTMAGNFQHLYYFFSNNGSFEGYWYPNAVRFIPYTISDFPMYSFATAYFHELISLPLVLLAIGVIYVLFAVHADMKNLKMEKYYLLAFIAWILSIIYMTNTSDWMIYILFIALFLFARMLAFYRFSYVIAKNILAYVVAVVVLSIFFMAPFYFDFRPFVKGISFVQSGSSLFQLFILWGFYFFVAASFMILIIFLESRIKHSVKHGKSGKGINVADLFVAAMFVFSFILIAVPEIVYIKDIYEATHPRASTMYKLVYQSWMMLSLGTGYIFIRWLTFSQKEIAFAWTMIFLTLYGGIMMYPRFAIGSYYHDLNGYKGLMGLDWIKNSYPDDYLAIEWINSNIDGQPVIVEGAGDDFTHYGRISANTGLLDIINWGSHEWLWRGSYDESGKRLEDVRRIYESNDVSETKALLKKYHAEYIIIGSLEKAKYPALNEENIKKISSPIFKSGTIELYKIN